MKQQLQIRTGLQLTMTPQLKQAIRLLQLSQLELRQEINAILETNSLLEVDGESAQEEVVTEWSSAEPMKSSAKSRDDEDDDFIFQRPQEITLVEHLYWQLGLSNLSERDKVIAQNIIEALTDDGYLLLPLEEIQSGLIDIYPDLDLAEVEVMLHFVQQLDPLGVGAQSLSECLKLQLKALPDNRYIQFCLEILDNHLDLLSKKNFAKLKSSLKLTEQDLKSILSILAKLNPKPGSKFYSQKSDYIVADILVSKKEGKYVVELNNDLLPRLRVNPSYAALVKRADSSRENVFLKDQLNEAKWFIKSIKNRNETLLKVATAIMQEQIEFLEGGAEKMKPLVLQAIASRIGMHESTISRITTNKYIYTPQGIFELKFFFSSHISNRDGIDCSSTAIRAFIKKLIAEEKKPLSDQKIAEILGQNGVHVARRTVAKYREAMAIPPSNERKCFS